jgi:hypothetical protein
LTLVLVLAACASSAPTLTIPEHDLKTPAPEVRPRASQVTPRLVPYPGLDVSFVANAEGEVLWHRGVFYTYFNGEWFYTRRLNGTWNFIQMKYVHSDVFRAHGRRP